MTRVALTEPFARWLNGLRDRKAVKKVAVAMERLPKGLATSSG
jgi:putative component of toxin-antitoxin plasmid stabilization module